MHQNYIYNTKLLFNLILLTYNISWFTYFYVNIQLIYSTCTQRIGKNMTLLLGNICVQKLSLFLLSFCTQIQMDNNARKLRNQDINPCIDVRLPIIYILNCVKQLLAAGMWSLKFLNPVLFSHVLLFFFFFFSGKWCLTEVFGCLQLW